MGQEGKWRSSTWFTRTLNELLTSQEEAWTASSKFFLLSNKTKFESWFEWFLATLMPWPRETGFAHFERWVTILSPPFECIGFLGASPAAAATWPIQLISSSSKLSFSSFVEINSFEILDFWNHQILYKESFASFVSNLRMSAAADWDLTNQLHFLSRRLLQPD